MGNSYLSGRSTRSAASGRKSYLSVEQAIDEQAKRIHTAVNTTGKTLAQYCVQLSNSGAYNIEDVKRELLKLVDGFSTDQQVEILSTALAAMIVN